MKNVTHERRVLQWTFMSSLEVIDFAYDILMATFIYKARCTAGSRKTRYENWDGKNKTKFMSFFQKTNQDTTPSNEPIENVENLW